jgi:CRISPR-associated endonuclease Cas1
LQRLYTNRNRQFVGAGWFDSILRDVKNTQSVDSVRGFEGACAGRYFELLHSFFPQNLPMERRSRQPPHNEVNACLSYIYTILLTEIISHTYATGMEPGWGFYHEPDDSKPALALDLLEPFRAPVADALTLDLINHNRLKKEDFEYRNGGCFLRRESRRIVFASLENRLEREFSSEQAGHRTTLRQTLINQCYGIRRAFNNEGEYKPFLMN